LRLRNWLGRSEGVVLTQRHRGTEEHRDMRVMKEVLCVGSGAGPQVLKTLCSSVSLCLCVKKPYMKYKLTKDEIACIESMIRPME